MQQADTTEKERQALKRVKPDLGGFRNGIFIEPDPIDFANHAGYGSIFDGETLAGWDGRLLLIAGDRDAFCAVADLEKFHREAGERSTMKIIAGADHFFGGFTSELERIVAEAIRAG